MPINLHQQCNLRVSRPLVNRRDFVAGVAVGAMVAPAQVLARAPAPAGLHHQDWFETTKRDLRQDHSQAIAQNKFLVLLWEQLGCTYCRQMHGIAFQQDDIVALAKANFYIIQMDMRGTREFVDLNGQTMSEAGIAQALHVTTTPTTLFIDERGEPVFRMPGYAAPPLFKAVYRYVIERGYLDASLREWVRSNYK
ncbi:MAG: thioredoxin family protein [Alphaproteobacteria bacterium]